MAMSFEEWYERLDAELAKHGARSSDFASEDLLAEFRAGADPAVVAAHLLLNLRQAMSQQGSPMPTSNSVSPGVGAGQARLWISLFAVVLICVSPCAWLLLRKPGSSTERGTVELQPGQFVLAGLAGKTTAAWAFDSLESGQEGAKFGNAGDNEGLKRLRISNKAMMLRYGTRLRVIECKPWDGLVRVRVQDGQLAGADLWVFEGGVH